MKDYIGRSIQIGDVLVYPVRERSKMWLNKMIVTGFESREKGPAVTGYLPDHPEKRRVAITALDRCVVVTTA